MSVEEASAIPLDSPLDRSWPAQLPFYYGWVNVVVGALAMVATMPGRTQGLGLFTKPLLHDLVLKPTELAQINFWVTLIGALFCLPIGGWIDRWGTRLVVTLIVGALGLTVWGLSAVQGVVSLFILLVLTRGFGQSALSVVSIAMVGKWFRRRISLAMGIYSVIMGLGFAAAFRTVGRCIETNGWREAMAGIAMALLFGYLPLALLLTRSTPERSDVVPDEPAAADPLARVGFRLGQALGTPAFWVFALGTSLFGAVSGGIGLFNLPILEELHFDAKVYYDMLALSFLVGTVSHLVGGAIGWFWSLKRLMAVGMFLYAAALLWVPNIHTLNQLRAYTVLMSMAGGIITVVFFAIWSAAFGRAHYGRIQAAAQMATVLISGFGPVLFAECQARTGSYLPTFYILAPVVILLGVAAWFVPLPVLDRATESVEPATAPA